MEEGEEILVEIWFEAPKLGINGLRPSID